MHGESDDAEIIERVRAGDAAAFDLLVGRHGDRLYGMLLHMANGDAELAAEFAQEAFIRAFERLDRFDGSSAFYTWLYRLARNRALDLLALRRPKAMERELLDAAADAAGPSRCDDPGERMLQAELRDQVRAALAALAPEHREIILLRDFEELDYGEIAARLEVAEGTVKSRLHRARHALRVILEPRLATGAE